MGAHTRGRSACINGEPRSSCPYHDHRTMRGAVTWSRGFRKSWLAGWDEEDLTRTLEERLREARKLAVEFGADLVITYRVTGVKDPVWSVKCGQRLTERPKLPHAVADMVEALRTVQLRRKELGLS